MQSETVSLFYEYHSHDCKLPVYPIYYSYEITDVFHR